MTTNFDFKRPNPENGTAFLSILLTNQNVMFYIYFFLSASTGKMNQILQSDWFRERAEFSDLDRGQRKGPRGVSYMYRNLGK